MLHIGSGWPGFVCRFGWLLLLPIVAGCGPGQGKVSGRVLLGGAPLPGGIVMFRPADPKQNSISAVLDEQGHYEAVLPGGEVQVSIDNRTLQSHELPFRGMPPGLPGGVAQKIAEAQKANAAAAKAAAATNPNAPQKIPGKYVEIPKRYYDISTSGLKFTVKGGDQQQDIELTK
jgi:hypothetical protein